MRERAEISDMRVERVEGSNDIRFVVILENQGEVHVKGKGEVTVKTVQGSRIETAPLDAGRGFVLPDLRREFSAVVGRRLATGDYIAEASVTYGARGRTTAKAPFSISAEGLTTTGSLASEAIVRFLVDPYLVDVAASPGAFRTVPILIENEDEVTIHVSGQALDVAFDADGLMAVSEASEGEWSCATWVELAPAAFDLRPRERRRVMAKIAVPKDVAGGRAAQMNFKAAIAEGEEKEAKESSAGTTLLVTIPGELNIDGEITGVSVSQAGAQQALKFEVSFRNNGNVHLEPKGTIIISPLIEGNPGRMVGEVQIDEVYDVVLPGGIRRLRASYAMNLRPGRFRADVTIDFGADDPATATRDFTAR